MTRRSSSATGLVPAALLAFHHVGYPALLWAIGRGSSAANTGGGILAGLVEIQDPEAARCGPAGTEDQPACCAPPASGLPRVALVIPAHNEASVIRAKIETSLQLDYPRELLRIVVAADGCTDDTVHAAREAGADLVLDLPRGGKMAAQHAAVAAVDEPVVAFSDANSTWEPTALSALVAALAPGAQWDGAAPNTALPLVARPVGYACGHVRFVQAGDDVGDDANQEGLYWRYEMAIRARESALASVTAGNGAIYAIRRAAYADYAFDPVQGHDLAMPFQLVRAGWRAVDVPAANATEKMVPTTTGELRRKRRMMSHAWPIVLRAGLLDLRGQPPAYAGMLVSHRWLRYGAPLLHGWLAAGSLLGARHSRTARLLVAGQLALLALAAKPGGLPGPLRPFGKIARYYVGTNAAIALGLRDYLVDGTEAAWTPPEGTR